MENGQVLKASSRPTPRATIPARPTASCSRWTRAAGGSTASRLASSEAETWTQDKEGWTTCYFNCKPNLATAAKAMGGQEDPDKGGFVFNTVAEAKEVAEVLGQHIDLPDPSLLERQSHLKVA